ncbi:MAG: PQQ-binding-like beta-propeller repeat protein [FCB group bacterium]|jgi:outer membrane protein assembly factor BamB|nr:PQQ-binding-like beta-propeller repeat protein [FCB group bacterium]
MRPLYGVLLLALLAGACSEPAAPKPEPAAVPVPEPKMMAADWPTYHGTYALDGAVDLTLPEKPVQRWRYDVGAPILNPPVAQGERIYVADTRGGVHAVDLKGDKIWSRTFTEPARQGSVAGGMAFDAPLALFESTLIACSAGGRIYAMDTATGDTRWETNTDVPVLGTPNVAVVESDKGPVKQVLFIDQTDGVLHALDFADGKPLWQGKEITRCDASPAVSGDTVAFGSCAGALHIVSAKNGEMLREVSIDEDSQVAGGVVLLGDLIYAATRGGKFIHANYRTGEIVWVNEDCEEDALTTPAVRGDAIVFSGDDGGVYCLERESGKLRWRVEFKGQPTSPVIVGDKVAVASRGKLYLLRLSDGQELWSYEVSDEVTSPIVAGELLVVGSEDGALVAFGGQ